MVSKKKKSGNVITLRFDDNSLARDLFGSEDRHLKDLEKRLGVEIDARGTDLRISGPDSDIEVGERILNQLYNLLKKGYPVIGSDIERAFRLLTRDSSANLESLFSESIFLPARKRAIVPRTPGQKAYLEAIRDNDIVFAIGPAGTGKSYLAVAMAVASLVKKDYEKIILARPAVEAGEKLGFLPGDMQEKVNPYLRPLYDALYDMMDVEKVEDLIADDVIEVAPLAFMRGRTLHNCFVILDEAQNCSYHQMKMCLTRLGVDSKMVVNGDVTQIDLPEDRRSGLLEAWRILEDCEDIAFHRFTEVDIVRHPLIGEIVKAYKRDEETNH
ncbi:MAG: PhoH family protein [Deltaproteobacteria bacterium]|jgi:phosphate starvation-inducible protein PhoH and related proteins|nr:PhoH family protein [Deltaproteobacteria bacterium]